MREVLAAVRGPRLQPEVRRLLRWWAARWVVRVGAVVLALVLVVDVARSWGDGVRPPVTGAAPPGQAELDAAIAGAEGYLDDLYRPLPDGRAVVSEYYALPLRARIGGFDGWVRPGDAEVAITGGEQSLLRESYLFRYAGGDPDDPLELLVVLRWDPSDGGADVEVSQVGGDLATPLTLSLDDRVLDEQRPRVGERLFTTRVGGDEHRLLRAARYTVRHVTMMSASAYRSRGDAERATALGRVVEESGYDAEADVYSPVWGLGERQDDDFMFDPSVYRDCTDPAVRAALPQGDDFYPYLSKVCAVPTWGFVAMSREDPLVLLTQGLHILQRYGDPEHPYSDGEHLNTTVVDLVSEMERRYRADDGLAECLPGSCDSASTSTLRTALLGMVETELGFSRGDEVARSYADAIAARMLALQVGDDGLVPTTTLGDLYRPDQAGGFFTHVSDGRSGEPDSFTRRQMSVLADLLEIRPEYVGEIATNSETTLVVYAFLLRYRCARFGVGCDRVA